MSFWIGGSVSAVVHVAFGVLVLGGRDAPRQKIPPSAVSIEVVAPEKPPDPPPPREEPEPNEAPPVAAAPRSAPPPVATEAPPEPEARAPEGPVDLGGLTLTNDGQGSAWSAPRGSGGPQPIARRATRPPPPPPRPVAPKPPPVVAASDLSRRPSPPALDGALAGNYPPELRRRGISGVAVVRILIGSDGRVRSSSVVSESEAGFGAACRRTVLGSSWAPPLDRSGRPVGTYVNYTCRFRVDGG